MAAKSDTKGTGKAAAKGTTKAAKGAEKGKPKADLHPQAKNDGLSRPVQPSKELAEIVGDKPLARSAVVSAMWDYIKKNELQDPKDKRTIVADDKLKKVFGKDKVSMFEMNKHLSAHLSAAS